jgi:Holliday junction resolvasome RuvABC endonuclease subunit
MTKTKRLKSKKEVHLPDLKENSSNLKILSLDIASVTGWAISETEYGVWRLTRKDESMGMKLIRFRSKLDEMRKLYNFDLLVYERPAGRFKNAIIHEAKLIAIAEEWCEINKVDYRTYSATEIKKFATNNGTAKKALMIEAAKNKLGYTGNDDNEADALWMLKLTQRDLGLS